jgi:hypothetical protein
MQEFSSVTASSYDAESLAPMLTAKASEGWSVVSIVTAGTNIVAYLTRSGGSGTSESHVAATEVPVAETPAAAEAAAYVPVEPVVEASVAEVTAEPAVVAQSWETADVADTGFAVAEEVTAITPTLPSDAVTAVVPEVPAAVDTAGVAEAAAAVVATGEPVGWGTSADAVASAATDAGSAVTGQVGDVATSGYVSGASDVIGGVGEQAGSVVGGLVDTAGSAAMGGVAEVVADVAPAEVAPAEVTPVVEAVPESSGVPAGWYADPSGRFELRYWDGNAWTEHVSRAGQQYTDPPVA